jgi:methanogenic corrinoid protein MtbC1
MSAPSSFAASVLDPTLSACAAGVALCLRERLGASQLARLGRFEEVTADLRTRLQYLAEALALGHPRVYLQHVDWLRAAHLTRGLGESYLGATHACLEAVLRADLPTAAWTSIEPVLAAEARLLAEPWKAPPDGLAGPHATETARLVEALLGGNRARALAVGQELAGRLGDEDFVEHVLAPAQRELGRLWLMGEIHVGEEHLGSHLTEEILARLSLRGEPAPIGKRVVVASSSGDLHAIGARMVAHRFERCGWEVCFLGANVPTGDLALSLRELEPHLLALSVTLGLHLRGAAAVIERAHAGEPRVPVLVGGPAFALDPELWRTIGADAVALDAAGAERKGRELLGIA